MGYSHRAADERKLASAIVKLFCKRNPNQVKSRMALYLIFAQSSDVRYNEFK